MLYEIELLKIRMKWKTLGKTFSIKRRELYFPHRKREYSPFPANNILYLLSRSDLPDKRQNKNGTGSSRSYI